MFQRLLKCPDYSFFLLGPRGVGKSTWLRSILPPKTKIIDLLEHKTYLELSKKPERLEAWLGELQKNDWVLIDEVQKLPALLDEVHRLIEKKKLKFALTGSSARKLKRGGANLLAGRAFFLSMETLGWAELKGEFNLERALNYGSLPLVYTTREKEVQILEAYVHAYLKEEIKEEGLVRKIEPFIRFLEVAGMMNGQILNLENIAREALIPRTSVYNYFSILEETLLGYFLPAYQPSVKVREVAHQKFYWIDPGIARAAAGLIHEPLDALTKGAALETWIFHELRLYQQQAQKKRKMAFYRSGSAGQEIDFIIELEKKTLSRPATILTIEVKSSKKWDRRWEQPSRSLAESNKIKVKRQLGVYLGEKRLTFEDFEVYPLEDFLSELFKEKFF